MTNLPVPDKSLSEKVLQESTQVASDLDYSKGLVEAMIPHYRDNALEVLAACEEIGPFSEDLQIGNEKYTLCYDSHTLKLQKSCHVKSDVLPTNYTGLELTVSEESIKGCFSHVSGMYDKFFYSSIISVLSCLVGSIIGVKAIGSSTAASAGCILGLISYLVLFYQFNSKRVSLDDMADEEQDYQIPILQALVNLPKYLQPVIDKKKSQIENLNRLTGESSDF